MFIGHYGPSFAAQRLGPSIPLWVLFLAVQLVDVVWAILVILGVERVRIVPGITAASPLDLYFMPYTHSMIAAVVWAVAAAGVYRAWRGRDGWSAAGVVGAAVLSHWMLDFLVHRPDLPLYDDRFKVGLGLWNYPAVSSTLEVLLLVVGIVLYARADGGRRAGRRGCIMILGGVLLAAQGFAFFGPPPPSETALAVQALVAYLGLAGGAYWLEKEHAGRCATSRPSSGIQKA